MNMKCLPLLRTRSVPVQYQFFLLGSPTVSLTFHDTVTSGAFSGDKNVSSSTRISLHLDASFRRDSPAARGMIRRSLSEPDVITTGFSRLSGVGSRSFPAIVPEVDCSSLEKDFDYSWNWLDSGLPAEELRFPSGGFGKGRTTGGGGGGGDDCGSRDFSGGCADRSEIGAYYEEMLRSNPTNSLLLRNYGRFLHEVERDMVKAEEYYGRAILGSPGDGEVLSLYGKLIWETERDEDRAKSYFGQAIHASPNDCTVLGSYAHFMWEAEEEDNHGAEENDGRIETKNSAQSATVAMVEVF